MAPYKVVRIDINKALQTWRPNRGMVDKTGQLIEDRLFNLRDMDRALVLEQRTRKNPESRRLTGFDSWWAVQVSNLRPLPCEGRDIGSCEVQQRRSIIGKTVQ